MNSEIVDYNPVTVFHAWITCNDKLEDEALQVALLDLQGYVSESGFGCAAITPNHLYICGEMVSNFEVACFVTAGPFEEAHTEKEFANLAGLLGNDERFDGTISLRKSTDVFEGVLFGKDCGEID